MTECGWLKRAIRENRELCADLRACLAKDRSGSENNRLPYEICLPLPPASKNHARTRARNGELVKLGSVIAWEGECRMRLGDWQPPRRPLAVKVRLYYPANRLHKWDIDGRLSMLLDVLGCHRDQWVDWLEVVKLPAVDPYGCADLMVKELSVLPSRAAG